MTRDLRRFFWLSSLAHPMHAEPVPEPASAVAAPAPAPPAPTAGEWTIGIVFVLAALGLVAWIAWTIASL